MFRNTDNLKEEIIVEQPKKTRIITYLIVGVVALGLIGLVLALVLTKRKSVTIKTLTLPSGDKLYTAHYTSNNRILVLYKKEGIDDIFIGIMDDDGSNFKELHNDLLTISDQSGGLRLLPFTDNKRALLGDYIFECSEGTFDNCKLPEIYPLNYPSEIQSATKIWTETIVSQDCKNIAWTTYDETNGSTNFIATLTKVIETNINERNDNIYYKLDNPKIISSNIYDSYDSTTQSIKFDKYRGGEVRQFINGGKALSMTFTNNTGLTKSVYQSLSSTNIYAISNEPGYDEGSIYSPDEKFAVAVTTRFSSKNSLGIIGRLPIPNSHFASSKLNINAYKYGISDVMNDKKKGNIGPALYKIKESIIYEDYHGRNLHKDDDWNLYNTASSISWHKSSTKLIFIEINKNQEKRIRKATLKNFNMKTAVKDAKTPSSISYAKNISEYNKTQTTELVATATGKKNGTLNINVNTTYAKLIYNGYSEDGITYYNGEINYVFKGDGSTDLYSCEYSCNVVATGEKKGEAKYRLTFNKDNELDYTKHEDGNLKTYGYSKYTYLKQTIKADSYKTSS